MTRLPSRAATTSPDLAPELIAEDATARDARARSFRSSVGLDTSNAALDAGRKASPWGNFQTFGVPLSGTEMQKMRDRSAFQERLEAMRQLVRAQANDFGGMWMDEATGDAFVAITNTAGTSAAAARVSQDGLDSAKIHYVNVSRSWSELEGQAKRFLENSEPALRASGINVTSIRPDARTNGVKVGVAGLSSTDRANLAKANPGYTFIDEEPFQPVDDRNNSGGQWKAGSKITNNYVNTEFCTSSFSLQAPNGNRYVLTAGHCNAAGDEHGANSYWDHNWDSNYPFVANFYLNGSYADVGLIDVPDYEAGNVAILTSTQGANITGAKLSNSVGDQVCTVGFKTTTYRCGTVTAVGGWTMVGGTNLGDLAIANFTTQGGDSGSPVFTPGSDPSPGVHNASAAGVVSGSSGSSTAFSQIGEIYYTLNFQYGSVNIVTNSQPYRLVAGHSGKCLDVTGGSLSNGALLQQFDCNGNAQQKFHVKPIYGRYYLLASHSNKCVDVKDYSTANGALLQQYTCASPPSTNQTFTLAKTTVNYAWADSQVQALNSSRCMDVKDASTANGAAIQQWDCVAGGGGVGNQRWRQN